MNNKLLNLFKDLTHSNEVLIKVNDSQAYYQTYENLNNQHITSIIYQIEENDDKNIEIVVRFAEKLNGKPQFADKFSYKIKHENIYNFTKEDFEREEEE